MSSMSAMSREDLLQELEKERRLRQQAEEENAKKEEENNKLRKQIELTTLPEFLDACHVHLFVGFSTRINNKTGTQGVPENATSKLRPNYIREWTTFPQEQSKVWEMLFDVEFVSEPHFSSLHALEEAGKDIRLRLLGSELDLGYYERYTVEDRVALVIRTLYANRRLRKTFNLKGEVIFENHGNTINEPGGANPASNPEVKSPQQSPVQKRRKQLDQSAAPTMQSRSSRPRADQFCVYNTGSDGNIPAFIIEYKAPHKLTLNTVKNGLGDIDIDDVVIYRENDDVKRLARRRVAAVITQTFSYMVQAKLEFGYICTGEVFIFLRVAPSDPTIVYYYLSRPAKDVGETTGWVSGSDGHNKLHLTAIGQVLAFTLRALRSPPHSQTWPEDVEKQLKRWEIEHDDILFKDTEEDSPPSKRLSDYEPEQKSRLEYVRMSPVRTRSKRLAAASSCRDPEEGQENSESGDNDDSSENGGFDPASPTPRPPRPSSNIMVVIPPRPSSSSTERKQYMYNTGPFNPWCTQKCLLGLRIRGPLDPNCPNIASHGGGSQHAINDSEFRELVREQIVGGRGPWGCESMHRHGTSGALFWLVTFPYGYTLVAKAMPIETVKRAVYEEKIYQHLHMIQGTYIPVCLGSIDISSRPLWYDGIFQVVHLLLLSHVGKLVKLHAGLNKVKDLIPSACESLHAIHMHRTLHCDTHIGNMFWNAENKRVMIIDFERAKITSVNMPTKKRKRGTDPNPTKKDIEFKREIMVAKSNMSFR
ncbi:hypothetical protein MauCBS54593_001072 [Microsporum audouinii]